MTGLGVKLRSLEGFVAWLNGPGIETQIGNVYRYDRREASAGVELALLDVWTIEGTKLSEGAIWPLNVILEATRNAERLRFRSVEVPLSVILAITDAVSAALAEAGMAASVANVPPEAVESPANGPEPEPTDEEVAEAEGVADEGVIAGEVEIGADDDEIEPADHIEAEAGEVEPADIAEAVEEIEAEQAEADRRAQEQVAGE